MTVTEANQRETDGDGGSEISARGFSFLFFFFRSRGPQKVRERSQSDALPRRKHSAARGGNRNIVKKPEEESQIPNYLLIFKETVKIHQTK